MSVKVIVREGEPIGSALLRFKKRVIDSRRHGPGPFGWMHEAKTARKMKYFHVKPSLFKRMKLVRKRFLAQRWSCVYEGGRPPDYDT